MSEVPAIARAQCAVIRGGRGGAGVGGICARSQELQVVQVAEGGGDSSVEVHVGQPD